MERNSEDLNRFQIIRKDARGCFVETKSDSFQHGKIHLEFASYDINKPQGQRQTAHVNIYIDAAEFLCLAFEAITGALHQRAAAQKSQKNTKPLYEHLGGTSAARLARLGKPRADGKSVSRVVKLISGERADYLFIADSGPGEADAKGLIVPRFGTSPENHVSVGLSWRALNELLIMTKVHFEAWLASEYLGRPIIGKQDGISGGKVNGNANGNSGGIDTQNYF
jgi:hypothetical protein